MLVATENAEYLDEIREYVCSRCPERPPGGPPCEPQGKLCGVELHLPELIASVRRVHSGFMAPYWQRNRDDICAHCAFLHSSICPCPMDYLAVLIVEAVEKVDERRKQRQEERTTARPLNEKIPDPEAVRRAYQKGEGSWAGCDWTTFYGKSGLDLNGMTAAEAKAMAARAADPQAQEDWLAAAGWLIDVERRARQAQEKAATAVKAFTEGLWEDALHNVEWAWALEFSTGRPLRHGSLAWMALREEIETQYLDHGQSKDVEFAQRN
jgi:hypothetical protein